MKLTFKNLWITINILLAASMVYLAFTKGFVGITKWIVVIAHASILLYLVVNKILFKR